MWPVGVGTRARGQGEEGTGGARRWGVCAQAAWLVLHARPLAVHCAPHGRPLLVMDALCICTIAVQIASVGPQPDPRPPRRAALVRYYTQRLALADEAIRDLAVRGRGGGEGGGMDGDTKHL